MATKHAMTEVFMSPATAAHWIESKRYQHQRNINKDHVDYLAGQMQSSRFSSNTLIVSIEDGNEYLLNGYHTLSAIIKAGRSYLLPCIYYNCTDSLDTAHLYSSIDDGRSRPERERTAALRAHNQVIDMPTSYVIKLGSAAKIIYNKFDINGRGGSKFPPEKLMELIEIFQADFLCYCNLLEGADNKIRNAAMRAYVSAIGIVTVKDCDMKERAISFWDGAFHDNMLEKNDPRKHLHKHLRESVISDGHVRGASVVTHVQSARFIVSCFNHFVSGKRSSMNAIAKTTIDKIAILGTEYTI